MIKISAIILSAILSVGVAQSAELRIDAKKPDLADVRKLAEMGEPEAQQLIYLLYRGQIEPTITRSEAIGWLKAASEKNFARAQYEYALLLREDGDSGVTKDANQSLILMTKAADQGLAFAQLELGKHYFKGEGVERDKDKAMKLFRRAAKTGLLDAQLLLGLLYTGEPSSGVLRDDRAALTWFGHAAAQGAPYAQAKLGFAHEQGIGLEVNKQIAYFWYLVASSGGNKDAAQKLATLEKALTPTQREKARLDAKTWKPRIVSPEKLMALHPVDYWD